MSESWRLIGETTCGLQVHVGGEDRPRSALFRLRQKDCGAAVALFVTSADELVALLKAGQRRELTAGEKVDRALRYQLDSHATPNGIRSLRKARRLTQAELGLELDVSGNTVARWERGERRPSGQSRDRLLTWIKDGRS